MQTHPIDFHPPAEEATPILLPVTTTLFAERAARFDALAEGHTLADWLHFLGQLSRAQHASLKIVADLPLPDAASLEQSLQHGMPPLNLSTRPAVWRDVLREIARQLGNDVPEGALAALDALLAADDATLERLAETLLTGDIDARTAAKLPFIAAALQVVYTRQASLLETRHLKVMDTHNVCPCCGSPAVASIVRLGSAINNLRYLHCSLCNTEWNVTRAVCTACDTDKAVALQELEGNKGAVRAETCDSCKSYLKIVYQDKDPQVDPVADDLASLALDMLVDEAGFERAGPNLLLIGAYSG